MVLHQTRVLHRTIRARRRRHPNAASRLLHNDRQDEAMVDLGRGRDGLNGSLDVGNLRRRVVGAPAVVAASLVHQGGVGAEHGVEVDPLAQVGEARGAVARMQGVGVGAGAIAVVVVDWSCDGAGGHSSRSSADEGWGLVEGSGR